jgi:hypothetical protein
LRVLTPAIRAAFSGEIMEASQRHSGQYDRPAFCFPLRRSISSVSTVISTLRFVRVFLTLFHPPRKLALVALAIHFK